MFVKYKEKLLIEEDKCDRKCKRSCSTFCFIINQSHLTTIRTCIVCFQQLKQSNIGNKLTRLMSYKETSKYMMFL
jgi:hypothetical protein